MADGDWSLGSVTAQVFNFVEDIPSSISGTPMLSMAERKRQFVQDFTGNTIGSNSIPVTYQDIIFKLTAAEVMTFMDVFGIDANSFTLGDMTVNVGGDSNLITSAKKIEDMAMVQLRELGRKTTVYKANG